MVAFLQGQLETAKILFKHGANPRLPNNLDSTPIHIASERMDIDMIKFLAETCKLSKEDLNRGDSSGETPLACLIRNDTKSERKLQCLQYLLENGADPMRTSIFQATSLHQALFTENAERQVRLILDHLISITTPQIRRKLLSKLDLNLLSPLLIALNLDMPSNFIKYLLDCGADPNCHHPIKENQQKDECPIDEFLLDSPFFVACYKGNLDTIEVLMPRICLDKYISQVRQEVVFCQKKVGRPFVPLLMNDDVSRQNKEKCLRFLLSKLDSNVFLAPMQKQSFLRRVYSPVGKFSQFFQTPLGCLMFCATTPSMIEEPLKFAQLFIDNGARFTTEEDGDRLIPNPVAFIIPGIEPISDDFKKHWAEVVSFCGRHGMVCDPRAIDAMIDQNPFDQLRHLFRSGILPLESEKYRDPNLILERTLNNQFVPTDRYQFIILVSKMLGPFLFKEDIKYLVEDYGPAAEPHLVSTLKTVRNTVPSLQVLSRCAIRKTLLNSRDGEHNTNCLIKRLGLGPIFEEYLCCKYMDLSFLQKQEIPM